MFGYKPDQGIYARGTAFWSLAILAAIAGNRFHYWLQSLAAWPNKRLMVDKVPVLGFYLTPSLLLGVLLFVVFVAALWKLVNHAKMADLLIDTESEMKKVTWPSFEDCKKSSVVVIGCVIFMLVFLGAADFLLSALFKDLIYR